MNKIYGFCHDDRGAYAILYAAMLPMIIGFFAFMINGCDILTTKARLNDAVNQGVYAVAVTDNRNKTTTDVSENNQLLMNYIKYYIGTRSDINNVHVAETVKQSTSVVYQGTAIINNHPVIMDQSSPNQLGMPHNTPMHNDSDTGIVKRSFVTDEPMDLVFVVDMSGSMSNYSMEPGLNRLQLLQKVVHDFGSSIFAANSKNTIGFVPFTTGVLVRMNGLNEINEPKVGCEFTGALTHNYSAVDPKIWHDKFLTIAPQNKDASPIQDQLNDYYINTLGKFLNTDTAGLIAMGYCDKSNSTGKLSCNYEKNNRIHYPGNVNDQAVAQWNAAFALRYSYINHYGLVNIDTIDYNRTLTGDFLFTDKAISTWESSPSISARFLFMSCDTSEQQLKAAYNTIIDDASLSNNYLRELSSNPAILDEFSKMDASNPYAHTDTNSGLMRAVPLIAKGVNPRKAIIVVSDGLDSQGPLALRDKLHKDYHICDFIKNGLLHYPAGTKTKNADIYYISLVNDHDGNAATQFWRDNCTGRNNAVVADNYNKILDFLKNVTTPKGDNQLHFINRDGLLLP
ncbi:TPA: TadE/TadG family type IV pilus assembly protein [Enterobacter hormaechei]